MFSPICSAPNQVKRSGFFSHLIVVQANLFGVNDLDALCLQPVVDGLPNFFGTWLVAQVRPVQSGPLGQQGG